MKRYVLMLGLAIALGLASCHKDCPPPTELWQVSTVPGPPLKYIYDENRLLTHITQQPWGFGPNFLLTYDQLKRPATVRDSISPSVDQFVYQGGKLVSIGSQTFSYDSKGRISRKVGNANSYAYVDYEYIGNSRNIKRELYYNAPPSNARANKPDSADLIIEYTYDNKHNPFITLRNLNVVPFSFSYYWGYNLNAPIVENNVLTQDLYGKVDTGYFKFEAFTYAYTYENDFPVTQSTVTIFFDTDGTPHPGSPQPGTFTYDKFHWNP